MSVPQLLEDIATILGGMPGVFLRYAAGIVRAEEKRNERVRERIEHERRVMTAAGFEAYHAGRVAGNESKGSGAR